MDWLKDILISYPAAGVEIFLYDTFFGKHTLRLIPFLKNAPGLKVKNPQ